VVQVTFDKQFGPVRYGVVDVSVLSLVAERDPTLFQTHLGVSLATIKVQ
jgi:hypothetical protein